MTGVGGAPGNARAIRVLALVPYPLALVGGQRYPIEQWRPDLSALGVEVTFSPFLTRQGMVDVYQRGMGAKVIALALAYGRRLRTVIDPGLYDVAYVYREAAIDHYDLRRGVCEQTDLYRRVLERSAGLGRARGQSS